MRFTVPVAGGGEATILLDDEDSHLATARRWRVMPNGYVGVHGTLLHRLVMEPPNGMVVDHIDHNLLDNRRSNLRIITQSMNLRNRAKPAANVHLNTRGKWSVMFSFHNRGRHYGSFADRADADALAASLRTRIMAGEEPDNHDS